MTFNILRVITLKQLELYKKQNIFGGDVFSLYAVQFPQDTKSNAIKTL